MSVDIRPWCSTVYSFIRSGSSRFGSYPHSSFLVSFLFWPWIRQIPHKLFRAEGYDHREALFGIPPYGGSIAQNVYYADDELCDDIDMTKGYPRRENDANGVMKAWEAPFILMVDRGSCTFVKKVSVFQNGFDRICIDFFNASRNIAN